MMRFSLRMAWRETRGAWRHFIHFFVCIALGVGALVGVALFASNVEQTVTREARALLGGDLEIRLSRLLSEQGKSVLESVADRGIAMTHVSELVAMAAVAEHDRGQQTQIVELKAVESAYPLYGRLDLEPKGALSHLLASTMDVCQPPPCLGAVVEESLLIRMGLSVGDRVKIGQAIFTITAVIRKEPDRVANAFSLGPRVIVSREGLMAAELIQPGSRIRERYLLRLPPTLSPQTLMYELRGRLAGESARIVTYQNAQPALRRFLEQLSRYLGLIGLTALFVGGIGVGMTVQAFIREKLHTIAVLKTVGADSKAVVQAYLVQAVCLGLIGSVAGAALGLGLQAVLPSLAKEVFASYLLEQVQIVGGLTWATVLPIMKGVALGLLTTLLFTLWPLLGVREIRPALIFRREVAPSGGVLLAKETLCLSRWRHVFGLSDPIRMICVTGIAVGLAGLAIWQAGSWTVGLLFILALAVAVGLLVLVSRLLVRGLSRLPRPRSLSVRQAVGNLHRPGSQAAGVMVAIGVGVMVIVAVSVMEHSLIRQIGESRPSDAPTFFFIDIQPDQKEGFVRLIEQQTAGKTPEVTPLVRSRLHALDGRPVVLDEESEEQRQREREGRKRWYFTREYVLTFLEDLPKDNVVTRGTWWNPGMAPAGPLVSVEEEAARNLGLDVGSTIEFDIQGSTVAAEVSSIRKVDWGGFSTNFYMILSPGSLEGAPVTYVGTVRVPPEEEVRLQRAVVRSFPNVTAINVGDVLDSVARILDRLSLAIRSVALFCILAGSFVMAAALAATKYRRLYESVLLKALGATRGVIAKSFAAEYALLGAAAGLIGVLLASALSWSVLYFFLDVPWLFVPRVLVAGFALTVVLALAVGFLSTFRLLGQRPLSVLRHE